eukprot:8500379-Alexandrium_andersonii.AAC.1
MRSAWAAPSPDASRSPCMRRLSASAWDKVRERTIWSGAGCAALPAGGHGLLGALGALRPLLGALRLPALDLSPP